MQRIFLALLLLAAATAANLAQTPSATVFEGARVVVGNGRVIDNATIVVNAGKIAQVGGAADVKAPAGA
jgi:imidazolonepropionase-like amidohydrolase